MTYRLHKTVAIASFQHSVIVIDIVSLELLVWAAASSSLGGRTQDRSNSVRHFVSPHLPNSPDQAITVAGAEMPVGLLLDALAKAGVLSKTRLITTEELAELIRMNPQTIAKWRSAGIADPPPAIHLGRQVRYDAEEVMAWIYRNRL